MDLLFTVIPALRRRTERLSSLRWFTDALALILLTLLLMAVGSARAQAMRVIAADDGAFTRTLVGFHRLERTATDTYRWSEPQAGIFLYGDDGYPAIVALRLTAPRAADMPAAVLKLRAAGHYLGAVTIAAGWRRYQILTPTNPAGESVLEVATAAYRPANDQRDLGVALSALRIQPTGPRGLPPLRTLWLSALPLLTVLTVRRLGAPRPAAFGVALLPALLAGWAAADPVAGGYWLPTLGWPVWPVLPLLLLITWPWLRHADRRVREWAARRPVIGWLALAGALAALLGLRVGWPAVPGLLTVALGSWFGLAATADTAAVRPPDGQPGAAAAADLRPLVLVGLLGLALALRLFELDGQPAGLWRDESRHGLQALRIWHDAAYRPLYVVVGADLPALYFYLTAPLVGWFGPSAWSVRLVSAVAGALTPLALYWAGQALVGRRAALFGAALLSWASWSLSMSRWAFPATLDHLLVLTAVGLIWRCAPGAGRRDVAGMALAGLLGGLALYTYHTGRMAPPALVMTAALRLLTFAPEMGRAGLIQPAHGISLRRALPAAAVAVLVGAVTAAPLAVFVLSDPVGFSHRVGSVSIFAANTTTLHAPAAILVDNLLRYAQAYHLSGDANGRHHLPFAPLLDPLTGLLAALGFVLALTKRTRGRSMLLLLCGIYILPGLFSANAPHAMRALGTLAPACLLAGVALAALTEPGEAAHPLRSPAARLLGGSVLALSFLWNGWLYFGVMRVEPRVIGQFDLLESTLGRLAQTAASSAMPVYLPESLQREATLQFLTWDRPIGTYPTQPLPASGRLLLLLPASAGAAEQAAALAALGPTGIALGPAATYPGSLEPLVLAFGRGADAQSLLAALNRQR